MTKTSKGENKTAPSAPTAGGFASLRTRVVGRSEVEDFDFGADADDKDIRKGSPPRRDAEDCIMDAMMAKTMAGGELNRLADGGPTIAVIRVPSAAWVKPIEQRVTRWFGLGWFTIARDGSNRSRDKGSEGNDHVASAIAEGSSVLGIALLPSMLPNSLVWGANVVIDLGYPDATVLRSAIGDFVGEASPALEGKLPTNLDLPNLLTAFRPGSTAQEIFDRLCGPGSAGQRESERLPKLEIAVEYGQARRWAIDATTDFAEYRAGRITWPAIESSAILFGPPGTGKTLFAKIFAHELGVPLIATSIADLFSTSAGYLDSVIKATNDAFARAEAAAPCVLFLDELDALPGRQDLDARSASWWTPVIANFLLLLDSAMAGKREGVFVIAATNLVDKIDPALRRPGRFERSIEIGRPDAAGVVSILRNQLACDLTEENLDAIGQLASGATGAELMQVVRTARRAARQAKRKMVVGDLIGAIIRPIEIPPDALRRIAIHEAGHIIVSLALNADEVIHAAIGSRRDAHGYTLFRGADWFETAGMVEAKIATILGGRAAEIAILSEHCSGSGGNETSDLGRATALAAALQFSEGLGSTLVHLAGSDDVAKLLRLDQTSRAVVERHLRKLHDLAVDVIVRHKVAVLAIADALAERRHLSGTEAKRLFDEAIIQNAPRRGDEGC